MKKIIFIVIFFPIICFSQDQLTYKSGGQIYNSDNQK
ncbi:MAG: hypothetical protein RL108_965, partial [Bacteroidota bacterium]